MKKKYLGFPWFHRKNYDDLLMLFNDGHLMPKAYDEWLKLAEEGMDRLSGDGLAVEKIYIEPETFFTWCAINGCEPDAKGRIAFTDECIAWKYLGKDM